ncbi:F-box domain [Macleaya cordata]|uniref:F-box domain n=1 Tax=Macleaya cordata TaxID=56857 RepID=A0A200PPQ2_MACCD|nr:F-box domain [Macleaya cordata]
MARTCDSKVSKTWPLVGDSSKEVKDWLELPPEIMTMIFQKLGVVDILLSSQWVCTAWEQISLEPELWRSVHLPRRWDLFCMEKIAREAVYRSRGGLDEFSVEEFATDELLRFVSFR